MQSLSEIRAILAERGLRPRHRLGQNFLHDKNQLQKLIAAADIQPGELVLEIGPGTGTLTEALVDEGAEVICCEIDRDLADVVEDRLGEHITMVRGDCLEKGRRLSTDVREALRGRPFKLVANLPYQVASPLMIALLIDDAECRGQFVTVQKEVAERLLAEPGTREYGPLGIIAQAMARIQRIATVKPASFWPSPKVTSAMIAIIPDARLASDEAGAFARFITGLFGKRRKQLGSIFGRDQAWPPGVEPSLRPEALSIDELIEVWRIMRDRESQQVHR